MLDICAKATGMLSTCQPTREDEVMVDILQSDPERKQRAGVALHPQANECHLQETSIHL